jgi:hypothetical protein
MPNREGMRAENNGLRHIVENGRFVSLFAFAVLRHLWQTLLWQ